MFWFKIAAEKHVFNLLQSVLVFPCPALIPPSSRYAVVSLSLYHYYYML